MNSFTEKCRIALGSGNVGFLKYDGKERGSAAKEWLEQFTPFIDDWSDHVALAHYKANLRGLARLWLEGAMGNEVKCAADLRDEFYERFVGKSKTNTGDLFKFIHAGCRPENLLEHVYKIRAIHQNVPKIALDEILESIKEKQPFWVRKELDGIKRWKDLINRTEVIVEMYKERSYRPTASSKPSFTMNSDVRVIKCFECGGPHYRNKCPVMNDRKGIPSTKKTATRYDKMKGNEKTFILEARIEKEMQDKRPHVIIKTEKGKIIALLDSGSTKTFVSGNLVRILGLKTVEVDREILMAEGKTKIEKGVNISVIKKDVSENINIDAWVLENLNTDMIIGVDLFEKLNISFKFENGRYVVKGGDDWELKAVTPLLVSYSVKEREKPSTNIEEIVNNADIGERSTDTTYVDKIKNDLCVYLRTLEANNKGPDIKIQHTIELKENAKSFVTPYYRRSIQEHDYIKSQVEDYFQRGLVRKSDSELISPVVLVKKKDGSIRFCIDYRKLNTETIIKPYPIPRIDDSVEGLSGAKYFTTMDLETGYHQIRMAREDQHKTAFITRESVFEWTHMPFGLVNAPFTFQKVMNFVFKEFLWKFIIVYLDDLVIFSNTPEQHLQHIKIIFSRLLKFNLKLNIKKCHFFKREIEFLGYVIKENEIKISDNQRNKAVNFLDPKNITELRSFIGFCSYFRKFIPEFTEMAIPLLERMKKNNFRFEEEERKAFENLKKAISSAIALQLPDFNKRFIVHTDASNKAIAGVLLQTVEGIDKPIYFISRKLNANEMNYTVVEKECLAVVWSLKQFRIYLGNEFLLKCDNQSLQWLLKQKELSGRLARWAMQLQNYAFRIIHVPGRENVLADALTRIPQKEKICAIEPENEEARCDNHEIIKRVHEDIGHGGIDATYITLKQKHKWKGMFSDIYKTLQDCTTCKKYSAGNINLQKFRLSLEEPFYRVSIDIVGPLPRSYSGNKFIIVAVDHTTRYMEARSIKMKTATNVAKFIIEQLFLRHGVIEELLSDQGKEFTANKIRTVCNLMKANKTFTSAYNPKANGSVERANKTLIMKLAKLCNGNYKDWDDFLSLAVFSYNVSPSNQTKRSPYELLYGRTCMNWSDVDVITSDEIKICEGEEALYDRLTTLRKMHMDEVKELRNKEASKIVKGNVVNDLELGTFVLKRNYLPAEKGKLIEKWSGPYQVIKCGERGGYVVQDWFGRRYNINRKDIMRMSDAESEELVFPEEGSVLYNNTFTL